MLDSLRIATAAVLGPYEHQVLDWGRILDKRLETPRWIGGREWAAICAMRDETTPVRDAPTTGQVLSAAWPRQILMMQPALRALPTDRASLLVESTPDDVPARVTAYNDDLLIDEPRRYADFFESIAATPLTDEQMASAVCFEDRQLLVAAAGSGKTLTMVARAGYAVLSGQAAPEQILMLAFNNDAAGELRERVKRKLGPVIDNAEGIVCTTFHALSLGIIGEVTGRKPSIPAWLESGQDVGVVAQLIHRRIAESGVFRSWWLLYSVVIGHGLGDFSEAAGDEDVPPLTIDDPNAIVTLRGEVVRSQEERMIADWLALHGIRYRYETRYHIDTADAEHRAYQPDFYYPDIDLYHEHFALDACGRAPAHFEGYLEGVKWKRELHSRQGTALFETTSHGLRSGEDLARLEMALKSRGLDPKADPANTANSARTPIEVPEFARLIRDFIKHFKSGNRTIGQLAGHKENRSFPTRDQLFLKLFEPILADWNDRLREEGAVDFEDMLNRAALLMESGEWVSPYRTVMVDEFQDTSAARARLIRALTAGDSTLAAVGDDWQAIYRFAGADITQMTQFEKRFGRARTLFLTRTFRSPQSLNDLAGQFVTRNPEQLAKKVVSANPGAGKRVHFRAYPRGEAESSLAFQIDRIAASAARHQVCPSVFLLGRYRHDCPDTLAELKRRYRGRLEIRFLTVHASKGMEADYVFILNVHNGNAGFPARRPNADLLDLVLPPAEEFEDAEERRLLYVAITRARRQAILVAEEGKVSDFVFELADLGMGPVLDYRQLREIRPCPSCDDGRLVPRRSGQGEFVSCSRFPRCQYKPPRKTEHTHFAK